ncbi:MULTISPECIES: TnpV protein [unclassified Emergencia]|uniref:TnpV protein n=1 Tax=Emergencia sp. 1XD21-10 TaxID=2304569 RepID=UPI00137974B0|nr:TnpV protein [Emergencia sp. 1XD21-10]
MNLEKERAEITYRKVGDVYLPEFQEDDEELIMEETVGKYGMRRARFLYEEKGATYSSMNLKGTLLPHLKEVNQTAEEMRENLIRKQAEDLGLSEKMKNEDPIKWANQMLQITMEVESTIERNLITI